MNAIAEKLFHLDDLDREHLMNKLKACVIKKIGFNVHNNPLDLR